MTEQEQRKNTQRAVLVGLHSRSLTREEDASEESLEELSALLETAGGVCVGEVLQQKDAPDPRTFIGEGKTAEVKELVQAQGAGLVIFDNPLSPSQQRALTEDLGVQVLDRAGLILDIFAQRAQTREGRLQVELAQYQYLLPRLLGMWKHLERQEGAIGTRGPGETQLESDRRHIHRKIAKLREELAEVRRVRATQRQLREKNEVPVVAIVGYTNAGKSTLLNALTQAAIPANDRLFDTLDTTTRTLKVSDTCTVLISDTVGFIRKLPHQLVDAFKATLEELAYADLLLHVIDSSDPEWREKAEEVDKLVAQLGGGGPAGRHRLGAGRRGAQGGDPPALRQGRAAGQAVPAGQRGAGGVRRDHRRYRPVSPQTHRPAGPSGGGLDPPAGAVGGRVKSEEFRVEIGDRR